MRKNLLTYKDLYEIFEKPYDTKRNRQLELAYMMDFRSLEVHDVVGTENSIMLFKRDGYWEVHIHHSDGTIGPLSLYKNASRLMATVASVVKEKLYDKISHFRVYGREEKVLRQYILFMKRIIGPDILYKKDTVIGPDGKTYSGYIVTIDRRTLKLELFSKLQKTAREQGWEQ